MRMTFLLAASIAGSIGHVIAAPIAVNPSADVRRLIESDKRRTYADLGAENGFTKEQWSSLYDKLAGFRYVNGVQVRDIPVPVQQVARAPKK